MAKTFSELCKDAVKLTEARVEAESPAIKDTPRRRFSVFQDELATLLAANDVAVDLHEVREAAEKYAYSVTVEAPKAPPEPAKADDIIKKFAKTEEN